ncbi:hypothetical protein PCE1_000190 [Barthelona sp. PCE]
MTEDNPFTQDTIVEAIENFINGADMEATNEYLMEAVKTALCTEILLHVLLDAEDYATKQLICVLLRQSIPKTWAKLGEEFQLECKQELLNLLFSSLDSNPSKEADLYYKSLADVIAVIGAYEIGAGDWEELLPTLIDMISDDNAKDISVVVCLSILEALIKRNEHIFDSMLTDIIDMGMPLLEKGTDIQCGVLALFSVVVNQSGFDDELAELLFPIFTNLTTFVIDLVENNDYKNCQRVFLFIEELVRSQTFKTSDYTDVVDLMLSIVVSDDIQPKFRSRAMIVLSTMLMHRPTIVTRSFKEMITASFGAMLIEEPELKEMPIIASELLQGICFRITNANVFPEIVSCIDMCPETEVGVRTANLAIGYLSHVFPLEVSDHTEDFMNLIVRTFEFDSPGLLISALSAIKNLVEFLGDEMAEYAHVLFEITVAHISSSDLDICLLSWNILSKLFGVLSQDEMAGLVSENEDFFVSLDAIEHFELEESHLTRYILQVFCSIVDQLGEYFTNLFSNSLLAILELLSVTEDAHLDLRGRAVEFFGVLVVQTGYEKFSEVMEPFGIDFESLVQNIVEGFSYEHSELSEFSFGALAHICEAVETHESGAFLGLFEDVFPIYQEKWAGTKAGLVSNISTNEDFSDDLDDEGFFAINSDVINEQAALLASMGSFADQLELEEEQVRKIYNMALESMKHMNPLIKSNASSSAVSCALKLGVAETNDVAELILDEMDENWDCTAFEILQRLTDITIPNKCFNAVLAYIEDMEAQSMPPETFDQLCMFTLGLISSDYWDEEVNFNGYCKVLLDMIQPYLDHDIPEMMNAAAIAVFAQVFETVQADFFDEENTSLYIAVLEEHLNNSRYNARQNAAFALGWLFAKAEGADIERLSVMAQNLSDESKVVRENTLSAICRVYAVYPDVEGLAVLMNGGVQEVFPLTDDPEEFMTILTAFCLLITQDGLDAKNYTPIIESCVTYLQEYAQEDEKDEEFLNMFGSVVSECRDRIERHCSSEVMELLG